MTLVDDLDFEIIAELATIIHTDVCLSHYDEDDLDEADETDHESCLARDVITVFTILEILDEEFEDLPKGIH